MFRPSTVLTLLTTLLFSSPLLADLGMIVRPVPLYFPNATIEDLNRGYILHGPFRTTQALVVRVRDTGPKPWKLLLRSRDDFFRPQVLRKPVTHLEWKLNGEDSNTYRDLHQYDQAVYIARNGGDQDIRIDFRLQTTWEDPPAAYSLDLVFTLQEE